MKYNKNNNILGELNIWNALKQQWFCDTYDPIEWAFFTIYTYTFI